MLISERRSAKTFKIHMFIRFLLFECMLSKENIVIIKKSGFEIMTYLHVLRYPEFILDLILLNNSEMLLLHIQLKQNTYETFKRNKNTVPNFMIDCK